MKTIRVTPNPSGAYPAIQDGGVTAAPGGMALWPEELETETFYQYNGFVTLTVEPVDGVDTVTAYAPNVEAWEEWKASLPDEPALEPEAEVTTAEMAAAIQEGVDEV